MNLTWRVMHIIEGVLYVQGRIIMILLYLYLNLRRSRDCLRSCVRSFVWSSVDSIHSVRFGQLLRCAHKRIVNIMKVYMERKNRQLELIRFRKKYRIYSRLLFRTDEVNLTRVFTLGYSLQHKHVR